MRGTIILGILTYALVLLIFSSVKNPFFQRQIITFGPNEVASKLLNKINCKCLEQDLVSACIIVSRGKNGTYVCWESVFCWSAASITFNLTKFFPTFPLSQFLLYFKMEIVHFFWKRNKTQIRKFEILVFSDNINETRMIQNFFCSKKCTTSI